MLTVGRLRAAKFPSERDDSVTEIALLLGGNQSGHYSFGLQRILYVFGIKSKPAANSDAMRIRTDTALVKNVSEQKISDLSADALK